MVNVELSPVIFISYQHSAYPLTGSPVQNTSTSTFISSFIFYLSLSLSLHVSLFSSWVPQNPDFHFHFSLSVSFDIHFHHKLNLAHPRLGKVGPQQLYFYFHFHFYILSSSFTFTFIVSSLSSWEVGMATAALLLLSFFTFMSYLSLS